jgi:hypothetical protein
MKDINNVGAGKGHEDVVSAYDAEHGKYVDNVPPSTSPEERLPTVNMPKAPDPSPFSIGPLGK